MRMSGRNRGEGQAPEPKITIPTLEVTVKDFVPPEEIVKTIIEKSSRGSQKTKNEKKSIEFSATLAIDASSPTDHLNALSITKNPNEDIDVKLSINNGELAAEIRYPYIAKEKYTWYREYNHRFIPAGTEVAPYCRSTQDAWECDKEPVHDTRDVKRIDEIDGALSSTGFNVLILGIANAAKNGSSDATQLIAFLKKTFPAQYNDAFVWRKEQINTEIARLKNAAAALEQQLKDSTLPPAP